MRIVYFGKWMRGVACLDALLKSHHDIVAIVAQKEQEQPSMITFVERKGIKVLLPEDVNAPMFAKILRNMQADVFVLAGYTKILKEEIISIPRLGCINLHGGRLPEYRGASPLNWQIINGEKEIGLSIFVLDRGIDTGDILSETRFPLMPDETITDVVKNSLEIFPKMLLETLNSLSMGTIRRVKQDLSVGHTYPKRRPDDGRIQWKDSTAMKIHNLVRALTLPYPGAFTYYHGEKIIINKTAVVDESYEDEPGMIVNIIPDGVLVATTDGNIIIKEVIVSGTKNPINAVQIFRYIGECLR